MDLQLQSKIAIVTGSSRGLGLASARALAVEGCRVCLCARGAAQLEQAARDLAEATGRPDDVLAVRADLTTEAGVAGVFHAAVDTVRTGSTSS